MTPGRSQTGAISFRAEQFFIVDVYMRPCSDRDEITAG